MKISKVSLQTATNFVMGYMLLAFIWWAIHLWKQNDRLLESQLQILDYRFKVERHGINRTELEATKEYREILDLHESGRLMVLGEGMFFTVCLMFGLWIIYRSARREVALARQRRNFMLSITHELKSPIASIRLAFETMCKRDLDRDKTTRLCSNGLRDAGRLQSLVEDLLLAARLEDNWHPLIEPVDLQELVQDVISGLAIRFPTANIRVEIPPNFAPVQADRSGLTSIIQNLLENAVKYSPEGAPVVLRAARKEGRFHLEVADEGQGIPEAEKEAVFEKFYRLGNEETRRTTGTGLGLYIVRQVVKAHKGNVYIRDHSPRGTVFSLEF